MRKGEEMLGAAREEHSGGSDLWWSVRSLYSRGLCKFNLKKPQKKCIIDQLSPVCESGAFTFLAFAQTSAGLQFFINIVGFRKPFIFCVNVNVCVC